MTVYCLLLRCLQTPLQHIYVDCLHSLNPCLLPSTSSLSLIKSMQQIFNSQVSMKMCTIIIPLGCFVSSLCPGNFLWQQGKQTCQNILDSMRALLACKAGWLGAHFLPAQTSFKLRSTLSFLDLQPIGSVNSSAEISSI